MPAVLSLHLGCAFAATRHCHLQALHRTIVFVERSVASFATINQSMTVTRLIPNSTRPNRPNQPNQSAAPADGWRQAVRDAARPGRRVAKPRPDFRPRHTVGHGTPSCDGEGDERSGFGRGKMCMYSLVSWVGSCSRQGSGNGVRPWMVMTTR